MRIERKVDAIMKTLGVEAGTTATEEVGANIPSGLGKLGGLTTKQHAVLQLIVEGRSNNEITEALGVSLNTTKVYVKNLMKKFESPSRYALALEVGPLIESLSDTEYQAVSGGLPKDWARSGRMDEEVSRLLRKRGD